MPEPDYSLVPAPSAQLALATNHLALLNKILLPAALGPVPGRSWEIPHLGLKMIWIEPGTFLMGYLDEDEDLPHEEIPNGQPVTQVTLTQAFWLGQTAVTQGQYKEVMGNNPSYFKEAGKDAPVENVSWDDAMAFCKNLTEQERTSGRLSGKGQYTLPTEAQWEYACRAGTTGEYAGYLDSMAWYAPNSSGTTHPVGTKQPNAWSLYDMRGNVWDWCSDWFEIYKGGNVINPTGAKSGSVRVARGGSWKSDVTCCSSSNRSRGLPGLRNDVAGFRVTLSLV